MSDGANNAEQLKKLNALEHDQNESFKRITQEIKNLIDENEDDNSIDLNGKLTNEVAKVLQDNPNLTGELRTIINSISDEKINENDRQERNQLKDFIKPYTQNFDFTSNIADGDGRFVKNINQGEGEANKVNSAIKEINDIKTRLTVNNKVIDPKLQSTLDSILLILEQPNKTNTENLQVFLCSKLEGKDKEDFIKKNYNKGSPDGQFGPYTMEGLMKFLNSTKKYINELNESIRIQEKHEQQRGEIAEQERINNLPFSDVIKNAPFVNNNQDIKNIINEILNIEKWNDNLDETQRGNLQSKLTKKREEQQELITWIKNLAKYRKADEDSLREDGRFSRDDRRQIESIYSQANIENTYNHIKELQKEITLLEDQLACNKKVKILNKMSEMEGHYKKLIGDWNKKLIELNGQKQSNNTSISPQLRQAHEQNEKQINQEIQAITGNINNVLKFFGWKENEGRIVIDTEAELNDYRRYKSNLEKSETDDLDINNIENIAINENFRLRGEWKKLTKPEEIQAKKEEIAKRLNTYIDIQQYLPDDIKTVLALAQKALNAETNLEDKNDGVWALERKLDELGFMGDGTKENNGVDGKFGDKTYDALLSCIDTSLKESTEIKTDDIKVTLRGEWREKAGEELTTIKNNITKELNNLRTSKREIRSNDQKIVLRLAKVALESESHNEGGNPVSDEVRALEKKLVELGYMPKDATGDDKHDGPDGKFGTETYKALTNCLNGETPTYNND